MAGKTASEMFGSMTGTTFIRFGVINLVFLSALSIQAFASAPRIEKLDPPSWWAGMAINPVRILIQGGDLKGAKLSVSGKGLSISNAAYSDNGHYAFVDLKIGKKTKPGSYEIYAKNADGEVRFPFSVKSRLPREGRFQGFSPDDVIYFLIPDRFADGDSANNDPPKSKGLFDRRLGRHYHGGDIDGVISKLDYIKSLGVTAIWTTPFYDNNDKPDYKEMYPGMPFTTGYHGYGAVDMYAVDEHLGDEKKLLELIEAAHAKGIKVIQDQVVNHTGPYHVWADDPPTPTWWNGTVQNHPNNNWQKWTAMNPRASRQTQARNIDGWFIDILPDFNQNDREVERYLIQHSIWWVENYGFDAIRMDTLPHVPRTFWARWMTAIKAEFPRVNVLGELFDGDPALLSYFQGGRKGHDGIDTKLDTLYDFALFYAIRDAFARGGEIRGIQQIFAHDWLYPRPDVLTTFLGVHDMERFMNERGASIEGLKLAQTLIMTSRGTPLLYYGDEIAMPGGGDPDNRRDFPGGFSGDGRDAFSQSGRTRAENDVWNHLAKLGGLRLKHRALRTGASIDLLDEPQQYAYARYLDKERIFVVFNNDKTAADIEFGTDDLKIATGEAEDALGVSMKATIDNGRFKVRLEPRTAAVYVF
ncbi:MAG: alpha-amylase family glycosyl hydrolase [Pyrinomonadaceae bacterium]